MFRIPGIVSLIQTVETEMAGEFYDRITVGLLEIIAIMSHTVVPKCASDLWLFSAIAFCSQSVAVVSLKRPWSVAEQNTRYHDELNFINDFIIWFG